MATIASLLVNLGMNTAGFSSGSKKGVHDLDALAKSAMALHSAIGIAQAGAGAINSIFDSFSRSAKEIADVGDLADRTGFSTEAIVSFQHGAKLAGVEVSELNGALSKMGVTLGKSLGGGGASNELDKLGLSAEQLVAIKPDEALGKIADAINRLPTPAEKAAAAVAVFGKSGAGLLNFLSGGSKGFAAMREEVDRLGKTFSEIDAIKVREADDAIDRLKASFGGLGQELVIGLAPALNITATAFTNMLAKLRKGDVLGGLDLINSIADAQTEVNRATEDAFYKSQEAKEAAKANQEVADSLDEIGKSAERVAGDVAQLFKRLKEDQLLSGLSGIDREVGKAAMGGVHGKELFDLKAEAQKLKDLEREAQLREHANELIKESISPAKQFADLEKQITDAAEAGVINWEQYMALYEEGVAKLEASQPKIEGPKQLQAEDKGPFRASALTQGSAEAFHASFGANPVDKKTAELVKLEKQSLEVQKSIDAKLSNFKIGA